MIVAPHPSSACPPATFDDDSKVVTEITVATTIPAGVNSNVRGGSNDISGETLDENRNSTVSNQGQVSESVETQEVDISVEQPLCSPLTNPDSSIDQSLDRSQTDCEASYTNNDEPLDTRQRISLPAQNLQQELQQAAGWT